MDLMEAAADLIVLYRIGDLPDGISAQVQVLARMSELTADAMARLRARATCQSTGVRSAASRTRLIRLIDGW